MELFAITYIIIYYMKLKKNINNYFKLCTPLTYSTPIMVRRF